MQREILHLQSVALAVLRELAAEASHRVDELVADLQEELG